MMKATDCENLDLEELPSQCAYNFKAIMRGLHVMRENDLRHIEERIGNNSKWLRTIFGSLVVGFLLLVLTVAMAL